MTRCFTFLRNKLHFTATLSNVFRQPHVIILSDIDLADVQISSMIKLRDIIIINKYAILPVGIEGIGKEPTMYRYEVFYR